MIHANSKSFGRPPLTSAKQKALILLQKDLAEFSNRKITNLLSMFTGLADVETSYKTIERAYSNPLVRMIIHNMFVILVKQKKIKQADLTGDGTGYGLTITRHYRTVREKQAHTPKSKAEKTSAKAQTKQEKRSDCSLTLLLLWILTATCMLGYGASLRSEKAAFEKALELMRECGVEAKSVRLDQYYGTQSAAFLFGKDTALYVIPKSNTTIR
jgi:transposase